MLIGVKFQWITKNFYCSDKIIEYKDNDLHTGDLTSVWTIPCETETWFMVYPFIYSRSGKTLSLEVKTPLTSENSPLFTVTFPCHSVVYNLYLFMKIYYNFARFMFDCRWWFIFTSGSKTNCLNWGLLLKLSFTVLYVVDTIDYAVIKTIKIRIQRTEKVPSNRILFLSDQ